MDSLFRKWFSQLREYETPHKKFSDLGRGLVSAGIGFLLAVYFWDAYHKRASTRTLKVILTIWIALWAVRIPLSVWYYFLRAWRQDYPDWGDTIAIPLFFEAIIWFVGAAITSYLLKKFLVRHPLPARIAFVKPDSIYDWVRASLLVCWIVFLGETLLFGIPDGDEGGVLTSIVATVILTVFLCAPDEGGSLPVACGDPGNK